MPYNEAANYHNHQSSQSIDTKEKFLNRHLAYPPLYYFQNIL